MDDATADATIERMTKENARLRQELEFAYADLSGIILTIIAGQERPEVVEQRLERTVRRLDRARRI